MPGRMNPSRAHQREHGRAVAVDRQPGQPAQRLGEAAGQPRDRAEVDDAEPPVGQDAEVARMRVGVQQPGSCRRRVVQQRQQRAGAVALGRSCRTR